MCWSSATISNYILKWWRRTNPILNMNRLEPNVNNLINPEGNVQLNPKHHYTNSYVNRDDRSIQNSRRFLSPFPPRTRRRGAIHLGSNDLESSQDDSQARRTETWTLVHDRNFKWFEDNLCPLLVVVHIMYRSESDTERRCWRNISSQYPNLKLNKTNSQEHPQIHHQIDFL